MAEIEKILDVVRPIEENRIHGLEQAITLYESSSRIIAHTFELCKRKIAESNGMESKQLMKKVKVEQIANVCQNGENVDPNIITINNENKCYSGITKEFKRESDCDQNVVLDSSRILSMKVVELREELMRRNLDTKGVKKVLQNRLNEVLRNDSPKDGKGIEYIENVDMISEKSMANEVAKDIGMLHTTNNNTNSDDAINSEASALDDKPTSEDVPMSDVEFENEVAKNKGKLNPINNSTTNNAVESEASMQDEKTAFEASSMIDVEFEKSRIKINSSESDVDNVIMEGQSISSIADTSPEENCSKEIGSQSNCGIAEVKLKSDDKEHALQENKFATEETGDVIKGIKENESQYPASEISNIHSAKKGLGHKLLKVTSKLFSPKKNQINSSETNDVTSLDMNEAKGVNEESQHDTSSSLSGGKYKFKRGSISMPMSDIQEYQVIEESQKLDLNLEKKEGSKSINDGNNSQYERTTQTESTSASKLPQSITKLKVVSSNISTESTIKKAKALQDARKARLAEMREKASKGCKVVTLANSITSHPILSQKAHTTTMSKNEDRKKAMAAEIRQKVAEAVKKNPEASKLEQHALSAFKQKQKVLSPMDTYEMSDRGESDSDTEDESDVEEISSKKKIPKWAQKTNLLPALEKQFLGGEHKVDPDEIFPEVSTCDLEAIFDQKKKRYIKRSSTGNWTKDTVTATEKLVYKRKMGFKR